MTIRSYDINLDSFNATIPEPIIGRQGDKNGAVTLHVSITDRGTAVDLTGQTINLMAETAKGTAIIADNLGVTLTDAVNGKFDYAIPNALWSESGKITRAYFSLNDTDGQQTTYDLIFIVKKAIDVSQKTADDYITIIDGTLNSLREKIDAVAVPETFTNLAAIQAKYPNGSNGIMIAADNGHKYIWANGTWTDAGIYQAVGIADGSVTSARIADNAVTSTKIANEAVTSTKTDFLSQKNLVVLGNFISGKKIQGDPELGMSLLNDANFHTLAINIKPSTVYSLILPEDLGLEDGYYWLKVATSTKTKEDILNNFSNFYTFDGDFKYTKTDGYLKLLWVNTGLNDKSVFIQLGKYKKPTYLEFLEDKVKDRRYSSYKDSAFPLFNSYNKAEVDKKIAGIENNVDKIFITKDEGSTYATIYYKYPKGYIGYRYGVNKQDAINLDTYRLIDIKTYDFEFNPQYTISNAPYDNEGVLKIKGESNYIGGVHGNEKSPVLSVFVDSKMVNFNDIPASGMYCDEIKFIVTSDIYHCDNPSNIAFKKTKQTYFDKDGIHVNNKWIAQHTIELERVRGCLLSVNKVDSTTKLIEYYYDDKVVTAPKSVPAVNNDYTILATDKNINNVFITGLIQCQVWGVRGGNDSELYSQITDFGSRIKPYFDCYVGRTVNFDDVLYCQNNFDIKYN